VEPPALSWSVDNCTVARALAIVGDKWTFVVLREVFVGIRRFDQMRARTGIPRQVLANRLDRLVTEGVLRRVPYREPGNRTRTEYRLTDKGFDLYPVLAALLEWGDRYLADPEGPPIELVHRDCGAPVRAPLSCAEGHVMQSPREVVSRPGPGAHPRIDDENQTGLISTK
jgi:DNA-binding HxlR family transcriptional regulator